jgi:outer membrane protein assembly factor BamB
VRAEDRTWLWVLTPTGQRTAAYALKPEHGNVLAPPVIGYDHTIYLVASGLVAFDAYGDLLWEQWPRGRFGGAGATTDGKLLVVAGDLSTYDAKGQQTMLFAAPGVTLVTPPAMSAAGEIFAASKDMVFCLKPQ